MKTFIVLLFLLTLGCNSVTISRYDKSFSGAKFTEQELDSFAWGFIPVKLPAESEICPQSKIDTVKLGMDSADVLLSIATFGIYVPHRAEIACAPAPNAAR